MTRRAWLLFVLFVVLAVWAALQNADNRKLAHASANVNPFGAVVPEERIVCGMKGSEFHALIQSIVLAEISFIGTQDVEEILRKMWWGALLGLNDSLKEPFPRPELEEIIRSLRGRRGEIRPEVGEFLRDSEVSGVRNAEDFFRFLNLVCGGLAASHIDLAIERAHRALGDPYTFYRPPLERRTSFEGLSVPVEFLPPHAWKPSVEMQQLDTDVFLLSLRSLQGEEGESARTELEGVVQECPLANIILDLRGNGGGRIKNAIEVVSAFLDGKPIARWEGRLDEGTAKTPESGAVPLRGVVVLIDGWTASAAEIVAAALRDGRRTLLVGERTFGKGMAQSAYHLANGGESVVSTSLFFPPDPGSETWHGIGIEPDFAPGAFADLALGNVSGDSAVVTAYHLIREVHDADPSCG